MKSLKRAFVLIFILFAMGSVNAQTTFTSTQSGDWDDGATYGNTSPGVQGTDWPATTDNLVVASGHTVTLTGAETINDLTINSGGVLDDDNKGDITVNGNLKINGTVTGSRNIQFTGGGGETIDGTGVHNSTKHLVVNGTASIASTANLTIISNFEITGATTVTNNGTVTINTDLKGATATWVNGANSTLKVGMNLLNGGGTLTASASGNTVNYNRDGAQNIKVSSSSTYYNLTIEGSGTTTMLSNLIISGTLTITSGTLDTDAANNYDLNIGGDFTNTSTFNENSATVTFDGTGSQTITNSSGETFYDLTINKASGTLTLANDVVVSNTLTMTTGVTDAGSNKLTLGTGTGNEGTYSYTAGQIKGQFERWIANTTTGTDIDFPVGTDDNSRIATINFAGITTGGTVLFQFVESDPGNSGLSPLDDAGTDIYNSFVDGYWDMEKANGFNLGGANKFDLDLAGTGFTAFTIDAATRLLTRSTAASAWTAEGTHVSAVDPTAMRTLLSTMPAQYAFGDDTNCSGPSTSSITGSTEVCTDDIGESYFVTDNSNTYTWTITGGTQASGGTTASITVDWGSTGQVGNVKVVETDGCTSGAAVNLSVNVNSIAPSSITGKTNVAESTADEPYSVTDLGYTYTWTITGGTLDTGQGTSSITVDWGTSGTGNVSVVAQKSGCTAAAAVDTDVTKYIVINSAQDGSWATGSTWVTGSVPLSTENARVLNTHDVTFTANQIITNLIIDAGGTLTTTNKIMTVDGDITVNGTYTGGTKQLILDGSNVTIDGTGTITLNSGVEVNISTGNKTIAATAVLSIIQGDLDIAAGITVTNNGSISVTQDVIGTATSVWTNSANSTLKAGAALLTTGTLNASVSGNTVEYNGTGAQNIKTPSSSNYYNLTTSGSGTKTVQANLDIDGDLMINGTSDLNVSTNTSDLTVAGDWANSSTFTQGSQTVTLDGSATQTISGTTTTTFNNLTVNNTSGGVTLSAPATISGTGTLTMTSGIVTTDATNILTVSSGGASTGDNASSYVDGPMKKIGNTDFTFPTGDAAVWAPVDLATVVGGSATTEFTAQYFFSAAPNPADLPASGLDHVSGIEYWDVTNNTTDVTSADLSFYWKDADVSGITDIVSADLVAIHYNSGTAKWEVLTTTICGGSTVGAGGTGCITATFTSFSPVGFGSALNNNALPIELVSFDGVLKNSDVVLKWVTASEMNNDFFTIERSIDGKNFDEVLIVDGAGNSVKETTYTATDSKPYIGQSYYRLKQTDYDGSVSYAPNLVPIQYDIYEEYDIIIYPNPVNKNRFYVRLNQFPIDKDLKVKIHNLLGSEILNQNIPADILSSGTLEIEFDNNQSGIYLVTISSGSISLRKKLVVE